MAGPAHRYEAVYREFDSPLMSRVRREAYGEDIGQHSWVAVDDLRRDIDRLALGRSSRLLDLGCGPCGPLTFVMATAGCSGAGVELSPAALRLGRARAASLGVGARLALEQADLDAALPLSLTSSTFDAVMSLDVVLHLRDRLRLFREIAGLLRPAGRFLFTDAGVVTGSVSGDEVKRRSAYGFTQLVPPGWNERLLESAGFRLIETEDRTTSVLKNASGRLAANVAHRAELEKIWGAAGFQKQRHYLETVIELSKRGALSRVMFLAECGRARSNEALQGGQKARKRVRSSRELPGVAEPSRSPSSRTLKLNLAISRVCRRDQGFDQRVGRC